MISSHEDAYKLIQQLNISAMLSNATFIESAALINLHFLRRKQERIDRISTLQEKICNNLKDTNEILLKLLKLENYTPLIPQNCTDNNLYYAGTLAIHEKVHLRAEDWDLVLGKVNDRYFTSVFTDLHKTSRSLMKNLENIFQNYVSVNDSEREDIGSQLLMIEEIFKQFCSYIKILFLMFEYIKANPAMNNLPKTKHRLKIVKTRTA